MNPGAFISNVASANVASWPHRYKGAEGALINPGFYFPVVATVAAGLQIQSPQLHMRAIEQTLEMIQVYTSRGHGRPSSGPARNAYMMLFESKRVMHILDGLDDQELCQMLVTGILKHTQADDACALLVRLPSKYHVPTLKRVFQHLLPDNTNNYQKEHLRVKWEQFFNIAGNFHESVCRDVMLLLSKESPLIIISLSPSRMLFLLRSSVFLPLEAWFQNVGRNVDTFKSEDVSVISDILDLVATQNNSVAWNEIFALLNGAASELSSSYYGNPREKWSSRVKRILEAAASASKWRNTARAPDPFELPQSGVAVRYLMTMDLKWATEFAVSMRVDPVRAADAYDCLCELLMTPALSAALRSASVTHVVDSLESLTTKAPRDAGGRPHVLVAVVLRGMLQRLCNLVATSGYIIPSALSRVAPAVSRLSLHGTCASDKLNELANNVRGLPDILSNMDSITQATVDNLARMTSRDMPGLLNVLRSFHVWHGTEESLWQHIIDAVSTYGAAADRCQDAQRVRNYLIDARILARGIEPAPPLSAAERLNLSFADLQTRIRLIEESLGLSDSSVKALRMLARPNSLFERRFEAEVDKIRQADSSTPGPLAPAQLAAAMNSTLDFVQQLAQADDTPLSRFTGQVGSDVQALLLSRGSDTIANELATIASYLDGGVSAPNADFARRLRALQDTVPLVEYRAHVPEMRAALASLGVLIESDMSALESDAAIAEMMTDFTVSHSTTLLGGVRQALHGLTPDQCRVIADLREANHVLVFLRQPSIRTNNSFQALMSRALNRAADDEGAQHDLHHLTLVRSLVDILLPGVPVKLKDLVDAMLQLSAPSSQLHDAVRAVSTKWDFISKYLSDDSNAAASESTARLADASVRTGTLTSRIGTGVVLSYMYSQARDGTEVPREEAGEQLETMVRQAMLAKRGAASVTSSSTVLDTFVKVVDLARRAHAAHNRLASEGHPDHQIASASGDVVLGRLDEDVITASLDRMESVLNSWIAARVYMLRAAPRLYLLSDGGRLQMLRHAVGVVRRPEIAADGADALLPYARQMFRSIPLADLADALLTVCADLANEVGLAANTAIPGADAPEAQLACTAHIFTSRMENELQLDDRDGDPTQESEICTVDVSDGVAGSSTAANREYALYAHALSAISTMSPAGAAPLQMFWASPTTTASMLKTWLDSIAATPGLVESAVILAADQLVLRARQVLVEFSHERQGRAGCDLTLLFASSTPIESFTHLPKVAMVLPTRDEQARSLRAPAPFSSQPLVKHIAVVAGDAQMGKSTWIDVDAASRGIAKAQCLRLAVHEGFSVASAARAYTKMACALAPKPGNGPPGRIALHIDVYDMGADIPMLGRFLHNLLFTALLIDDVTGEAAALSDGVEHFIYVELPALAKLDAAVKPDGPRQPWPHANVSDARQHPLLPRLGAVSIASHAFIFVNASSFPLRIDDNAALVAAYFEVAVAPAGSEVPLLPTSVTAPADGPDADKQRALILWLLTEEGVPRTPGAQMAAIRVLSHRLLHLRRMQEESARQQRARQFRGVRAWTERSIPPNVAALPGANGQYVPDFFRICIRVLLREAAQIAGAPHSNDHSTVWMTSPRTLPNQTAVLVADGTIDAARGFPRDQTVVVSSDMTSAQFGHVRAALSQHFGFHDTGVMASLLEDAGFVLTPHLVSRLLHAQGNTREGSTASFIMEGGAGVGKSQLMALLAVLINTDPKLFAPLRVHLIAVLRAAASARLQPSQRGGRRQPAAGSSAQAPDTDDVVALRALANLPWSTTLDALLGRLQAVVDLDPEPLANALGVPMLVYLKGIMNRYPMQMEAVAPEAAADLNRISALRPEELEMALAVSSMATYILPPSAHGELPTELSFEVEDEVAVPKAPPAPYSGDAFASARMFNGTADLLRCVEQICKAQTGSPGVIYRRILAHEGLDADEWHAIVTNVTADAARIARISPEATLVVFLDELNTAGALGAIAETFTNHMHNGALLPPNVLFVGAINRRREADAGNLAGISDFRFMKSPTAASPSTAAWARGNVVEDNKMDYLARTPFIVRALPSSLEARVSTHAGMSGTFQRVFLESCANSPRISGLADAASAPTQVLDMIHDAQELVRSYKLPRISVSIRDLLRGLRVFVWLQKQRLAARPNLKTLEPEPTSITNPFLPPNVNSPRHVIGYAAVMSVALTYWARLPSSSHNAAGLPAPDFRAEFIVSLAPHIQTLIAHGYLPPLASFGAIVAGGFDHLWGFAHKPDGIATTSGLKEAFWAVVVCVHIKLPLLLTGPPGCGKTLSFQLASLNLKGNDSPSYIFKGLKHMVSEPYQCSETSTAKEIKDVFERAARRQRNEDKYRSGAYAVVVSLDEAGLPPERRQALKSAHDPLDAHDVAAVFMSNTTLDEAKTSRMVQVLQSQASTEDREALAVGLLLGDDSGRVPAASAAAQRRTDAALKRIKGLVRAFAGLRRVVPSETWYDSRDFVFICKQLARSVRRAQGVPGEFDAIMLLSAIRRNLQTLEKRMFPSVVRLFMTETDLKPPPHELPVKPKVLQVLGEALSDVVVPGQASNPPFRHIMIVDRSDARSALDVVWGDIARLGGSNGRTPRILSLSDFPEDCSLTQHTAFLAELRGYLETGETVILVNARVLESSLYSLLNRHFLEDSAGGAVFVAMGVGQYSRTVRVHPDFRLVVHVRHSEIRSIPLPFLNRFERYVISMRDSVNECIDNYVAHPPAWLFSTPEPSRANYLEELAHGLRRFVAHCGEPSFHGLVRDETIATIVLDTLRESAGRTSLQCPAPIRLDGAPINFATTSSSSSSNGEALRSILWTMCFRLMQCMQPAAVFRLRKRLAVPFIEEYVRAQEHNAGATVLRGLLNGTMRRGGWLPSSDASQDARAPRIMLFTRTSRDVTTVAADRFRPLAQLLDVGGAQDAAQVAVDDNVPLHVMFLEWLVSSTECRDAVKRFANALKRAPVVDANGAAPRPRTLLVFADMSTVTSDMVTDTRRYIDEYVSSPNIGVVAFVLHKPSVQFFKPCYPVVSLGWEHIFVDSWGFSMNHVDGAQPLDARPPSLDDADRLVRSWMPVMHGLVSPDAEDPDATPDAIFAATMRQGFTSAIQTLKFAQYRRPPPGLVATAAIYSAGSPSGAAVALFSQRPFIGEALQMVTERMWKRDLEQVTAECTQEEAHVPLLASLRDRLRWRVHDSVRTLIATYIGCDWGLEAIAAIQDGDAPVDVELRNITMAAIQCLAMLDVNPTAASIAASSSRPPTVQCNRAFVPQLPLLSLLLSLLSDIDMRATIAASDAAKSADNVGAQLPHDEYMRQLLRAPEAAPLASLVHALENDASDTLWARWQSDFVRGILHFADLESSEVLAVTAVLDAAARCEPTASTSASPHAGRSRDIVWQYANRDVLRAMVAPLVHSLREARGLASPQAMNAMVAAASASVTPDSLASQLIYSLTSAMLDGLFETMPDNVASDIDDVSRDEQRWYDGMRNATSTGLLQSLYSLTASVDQDDVQRLWLGAALATLFTVLRAAVSTNDFATVFSLGADVLRGGPPSGSIEEGTAGPVAAVTDVLRSVPAGTFTSWSAIVHTAVLWLLEAPASATRPSVYISDALPVLVVGLLRPDDPRMSRYAIGSVLADLSVSSRAALLRAILERTGLEIDAMRTIAHVLEDLVEGTGPYIPTLWTAARTVHMEAAVQGSTLPPPRLTLVSASASAVVDIVFRALSQMLATKDRVTGLPETETDALSGGASVELAAAAQDNRITSALLSAVEKTRLLTFVGERVGRLLGNSNNVTADAVVSPALAAAVQVSLNDAPSEAGAYLLGRIAQANSTAVISLLQRDDILASLGLSNWLSGRLNQGSITAQAQDLDNLKSRYVASLHASRAIEAALDTANSPSFSDLISALHRSKDSSLAARALLLMLDRESRADLQMNTYIPQLVRAYEYARTAFAYRYTESEALVTPFEIAVSVLPPGQRAAGERIRDEFLDAWEKLRLQFDEFEQCAGELEDARKIPTLVRFPPPESAMLCVAHLVELSLSPGEEASNPCGKILQRRLLPSIHKVLVGGSNEDTIAQLRGNDGTSLNHRSLLLDENLLVSSLKDLPAHPADAVRWLVTGSFARPPNTGSIHDDDIYIAQLVAGAASRVPVVDGGSSSGSSAAAPPTADVSLADIIQQQAYAEGRELQKHAHDNRWLMCPACGNVSVFYEGCSSVACGKHAADKEQLRNTYGCGTKFVISSSTNANRVPPPNASGPPLPAFLKPPSSLSSSLSSFLEQVASVQLPPARAPSAWQIDIDAVARALIPRLLAHRRLFAGSDNIVKLDPFFAPLPTLSESRSVAPDEPAAPPARSVAPDAAVRLEQYAARLHLLGGHAGQVSLWASGNSADNQLQDQMLQFAMQRTPSEVAASVEQLVSAAEHLIEVAEQPERTQEASATPATATQPLSSALEAHFATPTWTPLVSDWLRLMPPVSADMPALSQRFAQMCDVALKAQRARRYSTYPELNSAMPGALDQSVRTELVALVRAAHDDSAEAMDALRANIQNFASTVIACEDDVAAASFADDALFTIPSVAAALATSSSDILSAFTAVSNDAVLVRHLGASLRVLDDALASITSLQLEAAAGASSLVHTVSVPREWMHDAGADDAAQAASAPPHVDAARQRAEDMYRAMGDSHLTMLAAMSAGTEPPASATDSDSAANDSPDAPPVILPRRADPLFRLMGALQLTDSAATSALKTPRRFAFDPAPPPPPNTRAAQAPSNAQDAPAAPLITSPLTAPVTAPVTAPHEVGVPAEAAQAAERSPTAPTGIPISACGGLNLSAVKRLVRRKALKWETPQQVSVTIESWNQMQNNAEMLADIADDRIRADPNLAAVPFEEVMKKLQADLETFFVARSAPAAVGNAPFVHRESGELALQADDYREWAAHLDRLASQA